MRSLPLICRGGREEWWRNLRGGVRTVLPHLRREMLGARRAAVRLIGDDGSTGIFDQGLDDGDVLLHIGNLAGIDLVLRDAAGLVGLTGDEGLGATLQLAGTTCGHKNLAVVRVELSLNLHRSPRQSSIAAGRKDC